MKLCRNSAEIREGGKMKDEQEKGKRIKEKGEKLF
jgi:hypothetical protein